MKKIPNYLSKALSKTEAKEITKRLIIIEMINKGSTYNEITSKLGVGSATIARVSKNMSFRSHKNTFANKSVSKKQIKTKLSNYAFGISS